MVVRVFRMRLAWKLMWADSNFNMAIAGDLRPGPFSPCLRHYGNTFECRYPHVLFLRWQCSLQWNSSDYGRNRNLRCSGPQLLLLAGVLWSLSQSHRLLALCGRDFSGRIDRRASTDLPLRPGGFHLSVLSQSQGRTGNADAGVREMETKDVARRQSEGGGSYWTILPHKADQLGLHRWSFKPEFG